MDQSWTVAYNCGRNWASVSLFQSAMCLLELSIYHFPWETRHTRKHAVYEYKSMVKIVVKVDREVVVAQDYIVILNLVKFICVKKWLVFEVFDVDC